MTLKMTGKSLQLPGLLAIIGRQLGVSKSNLTWKWVSFHTRRSKSLWIFECHEGNLKPILEVWEPIWGDFKASDHKKGSFASFPEYKM